MDGAEKAKESPRRPVSRCNKAFAEMKRQQVTEKRKRIQEKSAKELEELSQFMPDLIDCDAKALALRM